MRGGKCVRLQQGDYDRQTTYDGLPVDVAQAWQSAGAPLLHLVDLDGAKEGEPRNFDLIRSIAETVPVPVQTGGGIRSEAALRLVAGSRVAKAVLGTSAVEDEAFVVRALQLLGPDRLIVAIDAEGGFVKTKGWQEQSDVPVLALAERLKIIGVTEVLYTDISKDGMMQSVDLRGIRDLASQSGLEVIASGGVTTLDDLRRLSELEPLGVTGVIVGRALYEGSFSVAEALAILGD